MSQSENRGREAEKMGKHAETAWFLAKLCEESLLQGRVKLLVEQLDNHHVCEKETYHHGVTKE